MFNEKGHSTICIEQPRCHRNCSWASTWGPRGIEGGKSYSVELEK